MSELDKITEGVPQGSVLGTLIFLLFINDLPVYFNANNIALNLSADDSSPTFSAKTREGLESSTKLTWKKQNVCTSVHLINTHLP